MSLIEQLGKTFNRLGGIRADQDGIFRPVSVEELSEIENEIGGRIPGLFRDFTLEFGAASFGSVIDITPCLPIPQHISLFGFSTFYGAKSAGSCSLLVQLRIYKWRMPQSIIPIGDNLFGDQYCLGIKAGYEGKVYFWDHENEVLPQGSIAEDFPNMPADYMFRNVYLIAESFQDLLDRMFVVPE